MQIADRIAKYKAIETYRNRPLIVYATSTRQNVRAMMAGDAVREFIDQADKIDGGDAIDVLIHSMGGDGLAAWKIMSVLRERFKTVGVLVPNAAFSAATVFAMGANEIVMHPHASLGPIDPQIGVRLADGSVRQFAYEDLCAFMRFLEQEVGLSEQQHLTALADKLFTAVDPLVVGGAKRASDLSTEVGQRLLSTHMKDERKANQIAQNLNKSFFAHGDAVSRSRARKLELQVAANDPDLEKLLWEAYLGIEAYMELRTPFNPLAIFLADAAAAATLTPPAAIPMPPNMPPQIAAQVWQAAAQQVLQAAGPASEVPYSTVSALVESTRVASEFRSTGKISATRQANGRIELNITEGESAWRSVSLVGPAPLAAAAADATPTPTPAPPPGPGTAPAPSAPQAAAPAGGASPGSVAGSGTV